MKIFPIRLKPNTDLKAELDSLVLQQKWKAACIISAVGSLTVAPIRFANRDEITELKGHFEILSLSGTLSPDGSHLHISISDENGKVVGGHLKEGALVYTTAELVIGILEGWEFSREICSETGFPELVVEKKS